jgi:hypothetical protein
MDTEDKSGFFKHDLRLRRPVVFNDKKSKSLISLQETSSVTIEGKRVLFSRPNNVALFASITQRESFAAGEILATTIHDALSRDRDPIVLTDEESSKLYDYLERIQTAVLASYTSVESLANLAIPDDYLIERTNQKGIKETWNKASIERWMSTGEKIGDVVPRILGVPSPKSQKFWSRFARLEELRDAIIHQKQSSGETSMNEELLLSRLLNRDVFYDLNSGYDVVEYFCRLVPDHIAFPLGFSEVKVSLVEVKDIRKHFKKLEKTGKKPGEK